MDVELCSHESIRIADAAIGAQLAQRSIRDKLQHLDPVVTHIGREAQ